jgi:hypothetical protein
MKIIRLIGVTGLEAHSPVGEEPCVVITIQIWTNLFPFTLQALK